MNRMRILGRRARRSTRRQRIAAGVCVAAIAAAFGTFAFGSGTSHDPALLAGGSSDSGPEPPLLPSGSEAAEDALADAKASKKDALGSSSPSQAPLSAGVKPGRGVENLLDRLGVPAPSHRRVRVPGVSAGGPITVGVDSQDAGAANSFFREYGVDAGAADTGTQAQAVADWINSHGGVGGRRIELHKRSYDFYRDRLSVLDSQTCELWGGSERVVANIDRHASTDILIPCLSEKDVPSIVATQTSPALADFEKWPSHLYAPGSPAIDRTQRAYVQGLRELGFFSRGERIGVLHGTGLPQLDRAHDALQGALRDARVEVVEEAAVSTEDVASFFLTETQAMLKLNLARVSRVVVLDDNGTVAGQFMRNAENQSYRPMYGLNSISSPQFVAAGAPKRQLQGAVGVGWSPLVDVPAAADPTDHAVRERCDSIYSAAGVSAGGRTPFGQYTAYHVCDALLLVASAVTASGNAGSQGLRKGIELVGPNWRSPLSLATQLNSSQHDGASAWRPLRYGGDCGCFRYDGGARPF